MMWEYYDDKTLFITGGSGFLGTALVHRLLTQTRVGHVYLLCRGGMRRLRDQWSRWLPTAVVEKMSDPSRLTVLDGDILLPTFGLSAHDIGFLRQHVDVIVHSASSINLVKPLSSLAEIVIGASDRMAQFALTCDNLDRFIYVSTAYANTHLHFLSPTFDVQIDEKIYPINEEPSSSSSSSSSILDEYAQVQKTGTSTVYQTHNFPWPYAYAKNLTERLLLHRFTNPESPTTTNKKLLILRPSIIGPSQHLPFPGFSIPTSTPSTMLAASLALTPWRTMHIASNAAHPETEVTIDEVPVDVVVDRLLVHTALGTTGCIHAVSGTRFRVTIQDWWAAAMQLRLIPWGLRCVWVPGGWDSEGQHFLARLYKVFGVSFAFSEGRTVDVYGCIEPGNEII
ncbi:male sterility protein-domain-containing protein [Aspergillus cavernicola]|uniref:Fatty acyl-CoA reductase n=1 Tax=Aspergillus cavernicola TaxID=176166 RepID=A0ABR4I372_9EURO